LKEQIRTYLQILGSQKPLYSTDWLFKDSSRKNLLKNLKIF